MRTRDRGYYLGALVALVLVAACGGSDAAPSSDGPIVKGGDDRTGEYIAVFDADFVPPPSIVRDTIHHFSDDGVGIDPWVAWEYAKVRQHYNKLGLGDKTEIEFFDGPHTINGQATYRFLHRHLNWP